MLFGLGSGELGLVIMVTAIWERLVRGKEGRGAWEMGKEEPIIGSNHGSLGERCE
jgi:hypothetical protein